MSADLPPLPVELPKDFAVGVIYGPSQSGKSSTLKRLLDFYSLKPRTSAEFRGDEAVISHPDLGETPDQAVRAMTCVGLNTVPAWCRPFQCLSNGQQERVLLAVSFLATRYDFC